MLALGVLLALLVLLLLVFIVFRGEIRMWQRQREARRSAGDRTTNSGAK